MNSPSSDEGLTVLLPKNAADAEKRSRNNLTALLSRAGYRKFGNAFSTQEGFGRSDTLRENDCIFRCFKGAGALSSMLERYADSAIAVLAGSDDLAEAEIMARRFGTRVRIDKVLDLELAPCSLRFLAPEEEPINEPSDINGRRLFTSFPALLSAVLKANGIGDCDIRATKGADTRVNEWRNSGKRIGGFDIVGSGKTARILNLQIVDEEIEYPTGEELGVPYMNLRNIRTDLYAVNVEKMNDTTLRTLDSLKQKLQQAMQPNNTYIYQPDSSNTNIWTFQLDMEASLRSSR